MAVNHSTDNFLQYIIKVMNVKRGVFLKQKKNVLTLHLQSYIWQIQTRKQTRLFDRLLNTYYLHDTL